VSGTIECGVKIGTRALQIAWARGNEVSIGRFAGQEFMPTAVVLRADGQFAPLSPRQSQMFQLQAATKTYVDVPQLLENRRRSRPDSASSTRSPVELMAALFGQLRELPRPVGTPPVFAAVLAVPGWMTTTARGDLIKAAAAAGLVQTFAIDRATAAVEGVYFPDSPPPGCRLVFHLGATGCEYAVTETTEDQTRVVVSNYLNHVSVDLIDQQLAAQIGFRAVRLGQQISDFVPADPNYTAAFSRLQQEVERARLQLARSPHLDEIPIDIDELFQHPDGRTIGIHSSVHRTEVDGFTMKNLNQAIPSVTQIYKGSEGSTYIPEEIIFSGSGMAWPVAPARVSAALGLTMKGQVDPQSVVVRGAAARAGRMRLERKFGFLLGDHASPLPLGDRMTIGRARDHTLVIDDGRVSRDHAEIKWESGNQVYKVRDTGSSWGTLLNGQPLTGDEDRELQDGDVITIVDYEFKIWIPGPQ
jgi:molecular chaperone DnaK (HSP70)